MAGSRPKFQIGLPSRLRQADGGTAFPGYDVAALADEGLAEFRDFTSKAVLEAADLGGLDGVVLLGERLGAEVVGANDWLVHVARMGVGFDTVDVAACTAHDVVVTTTPDAVRRPMAVATITLLLALATRLFAKDRITREGPEGWAKRMEENGVGLIGRTLGVVGMGNIGREVFRLAAPFGLRHVAHDPDLDEREAAALGVEALPLEEVFRQADFLSLNCPLNASTRHLANAERLASMKPTAYLINTSRGPVVDQAALHAALVEGRIAGAGLDVMDPEPSAADEPLHALDSVILAPHALGYSDQLWASMAAINMADFRAVMAGRAPGNVVDREVLERPGFRAKLARLAAG